MANEIFELEFQDEPNKKYRIDEVINYSDVDFDLDRKDNGNGFDSNLSGGKVQFKFTNYRTHYLEKLLYINHLKGFEAGVLLYITLENGNVFIGELDFYTAVTDDISYFECSVILQSQLQIFKRRSDVKVDLLSSADINGNYITPLVPINMLMQSKPSLVVSEWKQENEFSINEISIDNKGQSFYINPTFLTKFEIEDSYSYFYTVKKDQNDLFKTVTAKNNLKNVKINLKKFKFSLQGSSSFTDLYLKILVGETVGTAKVNTLFFGRGDRDIFADRFFSLTIPQLSRDESIWIYFEFSPNIPTVGAQGLLKISGMNVSITAESVAYNSITPCFRLIDVMRQITKSTSGLGVYAPRYDVGAQFYDNVLTNGNLLLNRTDKPFYVSWDSIEKSIKAEHNADSEITLDGRVGVMIEEDFFTTEECGFFDNTQFSGMKKKTNPAFAINRFKLKYSKYQSLKEEIAPNSDSTIHGESELTFYNQKVENSKELNIEWVRDASLLESQRQKGLIVSEDSATQEDDTIFAIDSIETENDQQFTESTTLQHTYSSSYLSLKSNGEVNFLVLGIKEGTVFNIAVPDSNNGDYLVLSVFNTELQLAKTSGGAISSANDGLRLTKYTYEIKQATIPLTNRTNQGFNYVENLISPERYSNLKYSLERNIRNYWNSFLATCNLYHATKMIRNTYYKNNGKCETEYGGLRIKEKEDFIPTDPIMTPFMYDEMVFVNVDFSDFILLQGQLKQRHGFIRTIDNNSRVLKIYPIKMSYSVSKGGKLTISGNEKYEKSYLTITKSNGLITVNDETRLRKLIYTADEGNKIALYDKERQRIYNPIYWNLVSVNGETAETLEILKSWMDAL
jgi:hypothetical protein